MTAGLCFRWAVSDWGPCSRTCGTGLQHRRVHCRRQLRNGSDTRAVSRTCPRDKPSGVRNCIERACYMQWITGQRSKVGASEGLPRWRCLFKGPNGRRILLLAAWVGLFEARLAQSRIFHLDFLFSKLPDLKRRKNSTVRLVFTMQRRRFEEESVSYSETNWQESFASIQDSRASR